MKNTKRALLTSVLALVMCVVMLVGSTFAWFTDSAVSANNKIVAGELDVELRLHNGTEYVNIGDSEAPIFGNADSLVAQNVNIDTLWEPGKTQVAYLQIANDGNLALKYQVAIEVRNDAKDLYEVMKYQIIPDAAPGSVDEWNYDAALPVVVGTNIDRTDVRLEKEAVHNFALAIHMDEEAGNEYMNGEVSFDIKVLATQDTVEADYFSTDYDKDAEYPVVNAAELAAAMADPNVSIIALADDITVTSTMRVDTDKTINLNGYDFVAESGSRPFQVYGGDIAINATDSNVELDTFGLVDVKAGTDVKVSVVGGTFTGNLENGSVFKFRTGTKGEIYLKDVNMTAYDAPYNGALKGSYITDVAGNKALFKLTVEGGTYNCDNGFMGMLPGSSFTGVTINAKGFGINGIGTVENCTITTDGTSKATGASYCCVGAASNKTVAVNNSTLTATGAGYFAAIMSSGGTVAITNSTVTGTIDRITMDTNTYPNAQASITIDGVEQY